MKTVVFGVVLSFCGFVCTASAQRTKLKVAYPTTVGSMAVLWMTKEAKLFEKHGLDVELIYIDVSYLKELEQAGFIKKLYRE